MHGRHFPLGGAILFIMVESLILQKKSSLYDN